MSFWANATTSNIADGWGDDDDDVDLSDIEVEQNEYEDRLEEDTNEPPPPRGNAPAGGMFMGRLTRFIEAVTQPEDEYEEEQGEEEEEEEEEEYEDAQEETETFQSPTRSLADRLSSYLTPVTPTSGWDDDDSLGLDEGSEGGDGGWGDDEEVLDDLVDSNNHERPRQLDFNGHVEAPAAKESLQGGWDEHDDGLDDVDLEEEVVVAKPIEQDPSVPETKEAEESPPEEQKEDNDGWEQDEDVFDGPLEEGEEEEEEQQPNEDAAQKEPAQFDTEQKNQNGLETHHQEESLVEEGWNAPVLETEEHTNEKEEVVAEENEAPEEDGWDEEELELDDEDSSPHNVAEERALQSQPEPETSNGWNDPEIDEQDAGNNNGAGDRTKDGWDDDEFDTTEQNLDSSEAAVRHIPSMDSLESAALAQVPIEEVTEVTEEQQARSEGQEAVADHTEQVMESGTAVAADPVSLLGVPNANEEAEDTVDATFGWEDDGLDFDDHSTATEHVATSAAALPAEDPSETSEHQRQRTSRSPLVDHVPIVGAVIQRDSTVAFASESGTAMNDDTIGELDEQDFGPVVDQLPPQIRPRSFRTESVVTQVALEELDRDDQEVGEDTEPGEASEEPTSARRSVPPVVDHVPETRIRNLHRDSTIAVASDQSSTVMENIWKEDFDPDDDDYGPVVDQLPTNPTQLRSFRSLSSVAVQASIQELDEEDEEDEGVNTGEEDTIGTDGRPSERYLGPWSGASVADSMAVIAPIAEQDEENTVELHGEEGDIHDDETLSHGMFGDRVVNGDKDEPLVDHVPVLPIGRPTDTSTFVVADPSEVSTVGDMTYEESQYGLVVDQTPPPRAMVPASTAGSTVVAATKAESLDTEDDQDATTTRGDDGITVETRSVNDNDEENLVDHVPETPSRGLRRVNSSSAIAEAQSLISIRDDDFGLVVDQLPLTGTVAATLGTRDSVATIATAEIEPAKSAESQVNLVEVDKVPPARSRFEQSRTDSMRANKSVASEDATLETAMDGFGPVVDHLPTFSALGTPLAGGFPPSRGGSTTGALATLSEADDDEDIDDGDETATWDLDQESSIKRDNQTDPTSLTPETKNKSVTFLSPDGLALPPAIPDIISNEETRYQDVERSTAPIYSDEDIVGDVDEPETDDKKLAAVERSLEVPARSSEADCQACSKATGVDCPCVKRVFYVDGEVKGPAVVEITSPEGFPVKVDYNKLLQEELTKRLLLEKEIERYQELVDSLKKASFSTSTKFENAIVEVGELKDSSKDLLQKLQQEVDVSATLKVENEAWQEQVLQLQNEAVEMKERQRLLEESGSQAQAASLKALQEAKVQHEQSEQSMRTKINAQAEHLKLLEQQITDLTDEKEARAASLQTLQDELSTTKNQLEKSTQNTLQKEEELNSVVVALREEREGLFTQLHEKEGVIQNLSIDNDSLATKLQSAEENVEAIKSKEAEASSEVLRLRQVLAESANAAHIEVNLNNEILRLQEELNNRNEQANEMAAKLRQTEALLQESESRNVTQMRESVQMAKAHEAGIARLSDELTILAKHHEEELSARDGEDARLTDELMQKGAELDKMITENQSFRMKFEQLEESHRALDQVLQSELAEKREMARQIQELQTDLQRLHSEAEGRRVQIVQLNNQVAGLRVFENQVQTYEEALLSKEETIASLESQKEELMLNSTDIERSEGDIAKLRLEREGLAQAIASAQEQIGHLQSELGVAQRSLNLERERADKAQADLAQKINESVLAERQIEGINDALQNRDQQIQSSEQQIDALNNEVQALNEARDALLAKQHELAAKHAKRTAELKDMVGKLEELQESLDSAVSSRDAALEELKTARSDSQVNSPLAEERDQLLIECDRLNERFERSEREYHSVLDQLRHHTEVEGKLRRDIDSLLRERDTVVEERQSLEEENEEMLIQLGMNKEQMDAMDALLAAAGQTEQDLAQSRTDLVYAKEQIGQLETQIQQLNEKQLSNGFHEGHGHQEVEFQELKAQNKDLQHKVQELSSSLTDRDREVALLQSTSESMTHHLREVESANATYDTSSNQLTSELTEARQRIHHAEGICEQQERRLGELSNKLMEAEEKARVANEHASGVQQHATGLERAITELEDLVQQKDLVLTEMRRQMDGLRESQAGPRNEALDKMSRHVDDLSARLQESEHRASQSRTQLREADAAYRASQREVTEYKDRLSMMENQLQEARHEIDSLMGSVSQLRELELRLQDMQRSANDRDLEAQQLLQRSKDMEKQLINLQAQLEEERNRAKQLSLSRLEKERQLTTKDTEIRKFQGLLAGLHKQRQEAMREQETKEEELRREIASLQHTSGRKSDRIRALEQQLQSLTIELSSSKDLLVSKDDELQRVSLELERNRAEQLATTQRVTSQVLSSDMSKEEAESTETMRNLIVSLSQALENSESQRADAIERLLRERKASADSLKRLGESVKRFYSTLSCGGGTSI